MRRECVDDGPIALSRGKQYQRGIRRPKGPLVRREGVAPAIRYCPVYPWDIKNTKGRIVSVDAQRCGQCRRMVAEET